MVETVQGNGDSLEQNYDPAIYSTTSIGGYDAETEEWWSTRLTWKQLAERNQAEIDRLRRWERICSDLDRCEHGRHEGDVCAGCGTYSHGNRLIGHAPIGHTIGTHHIFVPDRAFKADPEGWEIAGPCRDPEQVGTPCPIGRAPNGS